MDDPPQFSPEQPGDEQTKIEADLTNLGVEVPDDPLTLAGMLLAAGRNPEGMTRREMILVLLGWARLKFAEVRIQAKAQTRPIQWSAAMTLAACAKRIGAPNRRKVREYLDRIGVKWEPVGGKRLIRIDLNRLPSAK